MWDLAGSKGPRVKDSKSLPLNLYVGHFLKPYFKDKVTGVVSPCVGSVGRAHPHSLSGIPVVFGAVVSSVLAPPGPPPVWGRPAAPWSAPGLASRGGRGPVRQGCPVLVVGPGVAGGSFPLFATLCRWVVPGKAAAPGPGVEGQAWPGPAAGGDGGGGGGGEPHPDAALGQGPPANEDAREKAGQGIKTFEELLVTKCEGCARAPRLPHPPPH